MIVSTLTGFIASIGSVSLKYMQQNFLTLRKFFALCSRSVLKLMGWKIAFIHFHQAIKLCIV